MSKRSCGAFRCYSFEEFVLEVDTPGRETYKVRVYDKFSGKMLCATNMESHFVLKHKKFQPGRDVVVYADSFDRSHKAHVRVNSDNYLTSKLVLSRDHTALGFLNMGKPLPFAVLYRPMLRMLFFKTFARVRHEQEERKLTEVVNCRNVIRIIMRFVVPKSSLSWSEQSMVLDAESSKELYDFEHNNGVDLSGTFLRTNLLLHNVERRNFDIVSWLLERVPELLNRASQSGETALSIATRPNLRYGSLMEASTPCEDEVASEKAKACRMVKYLLRKGADPNVKIKGHSLLSKLCEDDYRMMFVREFLGAGAKPCVRTFQLSMRHADLLETLVREYDVPSGAFKYFVKSDSAHVETLLERGMVPCENSFVSAFSNERMLSRLVTSFKVPYKVLKVAMEISRFDLLSLMLDHDCAIGDLPFCWYSSRVPIAIVKKMIEHPNFDHTKSYAGKTPFNHVMYNKLSREVAAMLIDAGCDVGGGLELSIKYGRSDISCLLLERGVKPECLVLAIHYRSMRTVEMLIEKKCDLDEGWPLHVCIETGAHEMGRAIIRAGANVDLMRNNLSPLMLAVKCKEMYMFLYLLQECDVDLENDDGHSAIYFAARDGVQPMVQLMVKHGAKKLNSAASVAAAFGNSGCLKEIRNSPFF